MKHSHNMHTGDYIRFTRTATAVLIKFLMLGFVLIEPLLAQSSTVTEEKNPMRIVIFGDSITAGYGLDPEDAFPAILEKKANNSGYAVQVVNAGLSGETSAGGVRRVDWILKSPVDIFVLELGANDALRGLELEDMKKNLSQIISKVRTTYPNTYIILAGMRALPNLGAQYAETFEKSYQSVAKEMNVSLIPFILEGVGGVAELNQPDGLHPTAEGQQKIADVVWPFLEKAIQKKMIKDP